MNRSYVIQTLRRHERELREAGVVHLRLFGSLARNEGSQHSDVDLLAEFDKSKRLSLVTVGSIRAGCLSCWARKWIFHRLNGCESQFGQRL